MLLFIAIHNKKAGATVPVTRPAYRGLRIADHRRTSNAEAHADMYNTTSPTFVGALAVINIPRRHLPLLCSLTMIETARFQKPKTKRQVNVFLIMYIAHPRPLSA